MSAAAAAGRDELVTPVCVRTQTLPELNTTALGEGGGMQQRA